MRNWKWTLNLLAAASLTTASCGLIDSELETQAARADSDPVSEHRNAYVGSELEFDPGPTQASGWPDLFAEVPNYREINKKIGDQWLAGKPGKRILDQVNAKRGNKPILEKAVNADTRGKFRFDMGPVFYRGRLDGSARVLVIGQDAATDEALIHRSFTGGTGQDTQHLLNSIGITRSYVFMNTYIYSVYEQDDEFGTAIAQLDANGQPGEVAKHRNKMFYKVFEQASKYTDPTTGAKGGIVLTIAIGSAAEKSWKTFLVEHGNDPLVKGVKHYNTQHPGAATFIQGNIDKAKKALQDQGAALKSKVATLAEIAAITQMPAPEHVKASAGVYEKAVVDYLDKVHKALEGKVADEHLKGLLALASAQNDLDKLFATFTNVFERVWDRKEKKGFLPSDTKTELDPGGVTTRPTSFVYSGNNIPWRDLPYGAARALGHGSTQSQRDTATSIALKNVGSRGKYKKIDQVPGLERAQSSINLRRADEVAWEPARVNPWDFSPGPSPTWAKLFHDTPPIKQLIEESGVKFAGNFQDVALWYRGTLESPEAVILLQDRDVDGLVVGRTAVGLVGQQLQAYLNRNGITKYAIIAPLPYENTRITTDGQLLDVIKTPKLVEYRNKIVATLVGANTRILAFGQVGETAAQSLPDNLRARVEQFRDFGPNDPIASIPRRDLPNGVPMWFGTSGNLSQMTTDEGGNQWLLWRAPLWIHKEPIVHMGPETTGTHDPVDTDEHPVTEPAPEIPASDPSE
jgi:hypothetical protein